MCTAFRLVYVRSIRDHHDRVHTVCISDTSADIASVSHTGLYMIY